MSFSAIVLFGVILGIMSMVASVLCERPLLGAILFFVLFFSPIVYMGVIPAGETMPTGELKIDNQYIKQMDCSKLVELWKEGNYVGVGENKIIEIIQLKDCNIG